MSLIVTHPDSDDAYEKIFNESVGRRHHGGVRLAHLAAPEVFTIPRLGTLNVHDALLSADAGFAPLNWALINDEPEAGVAARMMYAEFDAGDIVLQRAAPVGDDDTIVDLFDRTLAMFAPITVDALELVASGRTDWTPQNRRAASYFHRRCAEDNRIDCTWPARDIFNLVRASSTRTPTPTASTASSSCASSPHRSPKPRSVAPSGASSSGTAGSGDRGRRRRAPGA